MNEKQPSPNDEEKHWHNLSQKELFDKLSTSETGLSDQEARQRLIEYGQNKIEFKDRWKLLKMLGRQFRDFLVILLIVAAVISLITGELVDAIAIFAIVILNASIGFVQEYRSDQALEKLKHYFENDVVVLRDGQEKIVPSSELVPGDIVQVEVGDKIPADMRIIKANNLKIDEAPLTGESTAVNKSTEVAQRKARIHERKNMVYMGTTCVYGRGVACVIATGHETEMGHIAALTQVKDELTPLQESIDSFGKSIGIVILGICAIVMIVELIRIMSISDENFLEAFNRAFSIAIALAISAVPEGLAAAIAITLAIGVTRMAKRKAIISRLPAVETLGSVNYICSDKTGTLTRNEMTVKEVWTKETKKVEIGGSGYLLEGEFTINGKTIDPTSSQAMDILLQGVYHCNNAGLIRNRDEIKVKGDPTEAALIVLAEKAGFTEEDKAERVHEIFFDSERKRMTTIHKIDGDYYAFMKGSPPTIMDRCNSILTDEKEITITTEIHEEVMEANTGMSSTALRVLGVAYKKVPADFDPDDPNTIESDMIFLGLTGMIDPPRQVVKDSIEECRRAGITTVMITGDQRETAVAIAKEVGILTSESDLIVNGEEFSTMTDEELEEKIEQIKVYSRMDPKDKYRVVETLQELGYVVAVTGDGVNDAPALKKADIGVAMGITGTDVSKEVADMVITDDAFNTIVNAVEEGRNIFANMKRFIRYTLSSNFDEIFAVLLIISVFGVLPFTPLQILFLNLATDALPALALSFEPYDPRLMKRAPSDKGTFLKEMYAFAILAGIVAFFASTGMFLIAYEHIGPTFSNNNEAIRLGYAQLMAFVVTLTFELVFVFIARNDNDTAFIETNPLKNKMLLWAVGISLTILLAVVYIPPFQSVFTSFPQGYYYVLTGMDWLYIFFFTVVMNVFIEGIRYLLRHPKMQKFARKIGLGFDVVSNNQKNE